jgi:transcriptional regulator with XRE-family HTH domain
MNQDRQFHVGKRLQALRERAKKTIHQLAEETGLSIAALFDLEETDDLYDTVSIGQVKRLARALDVKPSMFFGLAPSSGNQKAIGLYQLPVLLREYLEAKRLSIDQFEDQVGYEVRHILADPGAIHDWNIACLMAVASELGLRWHDLLDSFSSEKRIYPRFRS